MPKPNRGEDKDKDKPNRGRGRASTASGAQAKTCSLMASETKQEKKSKKKSRKESKNQKMEDKVKPDVHSQAATPRKEKSDEVKKSETGGKKSKSDNKIVDKLTETSAEEREILEKEEEAYGRESLIGSGEFETISSETKCSPPDARAITPPFQSPEVLTEDVIDEQNPDLINKEEESIPQDSEESDKQELNFDPNTSEELQEFSSENERKRDKESTDKNESSPFLPSSTDVDRKKMDAKQETLDMQQTVDDETTSLSQDSNLMALKEGIQNLDISDSKFKQDDSSEEQNELSASKSEETINLVKDLNLSFEFDELGNKKVLVVGEKEYRGVDKQKITFDIGDGNAKLSFHNNEVRIFAQSGEITCSLRGNEVVFFIKARTNKPESTAESPNTNEPSHGKVTVAVEDLDCPNATSVTEQGSRQPTEETPDECGAKNAAISALKEDSSLVPRSEGLNTNELSHSKATVAAEDLDSPNVTGLTERSSLMKHPMIQTADETPDESGAKNVEISALKGDSSLVPRSEVQERLRNMSDTFLSNVSALCNDYENNFIKCIDKKNEDESKE